MNDDDLPILPPLSNYRGQYELTKRKPQPKIVSPRKENANAAK